MSAVSPIPVLLYHAVTDDPPIDQPEFTVAPRRFAEHVAAIVDSGRVALTVAELAGGLRGARPLPERAVAVTFDDGFADTPWATGLLAAAGISSTVFVTTGRLHVAGQAGPPLPPSALEELTGNERVELGAHTESHPRLDELSPGAAMSEIVAGKRALERHTGRAVHSFAYPHGAYDRRVRAAVVAAGFTAAAAVKNALSHPGDDPFAIARWTVRRDSSVQDVRRVLDGDGAPLAWSRERQRTRAFRQVRRLRRRLLADYVTSEGARGR
jgi:peptidoglycan/xylan/chitin deacetylase (PgdA/CDA1 family)